LRDRGRSRTHVQLLPGDLLDPQRRSLGAAFDFEAVMIYSNAFGLFARSLQAHKQSA
jgi:hypothetical protein